MDTRGGQSDNHVTLGHAGVVQDLFLVDDTDGKACQVVLLDGHHAGVLGGLATDQSRARLHAALGHAADDLGDLFGDVLAACDVVQEEQGAGATADDVVDAHGHGIDADGVVLVHQDGQLDLGAATVGTGNEHGLLHTGDGQTEATAEAADVVKAAFVLGAVDVLLHEFDGAVAGGDVDACGGVGFGFGIRMHGGGSFRIYF